MKRCPKCATVYSDEALKFCRTDGATLFLYDHDSPTAVFDSTEVGSGAKMASIVSPKRASTRSRARSINSIAILPFENVGNDPNAEYLSDGLTENIINNLSQLPKLKVMARSTVFRYKGQQIDPQGVANDLGVRAVATGRVQQLGERLMIGIELVDTADGTQLWGQRYERKRADIFALQEEISEKISAKLRLTLTTSQKQRFAKRHTKKSEAYELYLRGRYFWNKRSEEDAKKGIECFRKALAIDPNFAFAYSGLADCQTLLGDVGIQAMLPKEAFSQGCESAARALELDEALAEAHGTMGHISMHLFDWPKAESELLRALELNPNYAQACLWYAYYLAFTGHSVDSIPVMERALQLDPLSLPVNTSAAEILYFAGRLDESIQQFHKALDLDPYRIVAHLELGRAYEHREMFVEAISEFSRGRELSHDSPESLASLAHCYAVSGKSDEAQILLAELTELNQRRYVSPYDLALVYCGLNQKEEAIAWLNRAYQIHDGWMIYISVDPRWQNLRTNARFSEVVERVGLSMR
jgi:TolB-like protein/Flp pilus assembly protein TadD